jgi:hypothetical protein
MTKKEIIIDACFWINIVFLGLDKELINYFDIYCVLKVEKEILDDNKYKIFNSKDMDTFLDLKEKRIIKIKNPKNISKKLLNSLEQNSGELDSTALSIEEEWVFATDDNGAIDYCIKNKIKYINSVYFIIYLKNKKIITKNQAKEYLNLLKNRIKQKYIEIGEKYLK